MENEKKSIKGEILDAKELQKGITKKRIAYEDGGNKNRKPVLVVSTNDPVTGVKASLIPEENKIDEFYKTLGPQALIEFKRVQSRFATFQTFLQVFPNYELVKNNPGELSLLVVFGHCQKVYKLDIIGDSVLDLIPGVIKFINDLPEDVKKTKLKM